MKKSILTLTMLTALTGCSSDGTEARAEGNDDVPTGFEIQYTTPVPSEFFRSATLQGTIELLEYDSKDYTRSDRPTTHRSAQMDAYSSEASLKKPAYVYLPYGYDPQQKYDIINLLHGWTGVAQEYFLGRSGNGRSSESHQARLNGRVVTDVGEANSRMSLVNIFDNLIQRGLTRPFIAVQT